MFTTKLRFLTAGESHGPALTTVLEGLPAGLPMSSEIIDRELERRQRGYGGGPRMKIERDHAEITSGVMEGVTLGSPLSLQIVNLNHGNWQGKVIEPFTAPRPGHADLTGAIKYGYNDLRKSLERASARETAARVAVGAVCKHFLAQFGIKIFGYVTSIGDVSADVIKIPLLDRGPLAEKSDVRCPDADAAEKMRSRIRQIMDERDTLGGIIEIIALHLPPGLGSHVHWDRKLEARIGGAVLGVQAVKGVEFGTAFENTRKPGTQIHDPIILGEIFIMETTGITEENSGNRPNDQPKGKARHIVRPTNRAGGLEGGITTGQPLVVRAAMKPIATTLTPQRTVDLVKGEETLTRYERSDFCPVPRAVPILEAVTAYILADALIEKLGGDSMDEMIPRFETLRRAHLDDLPLVNEAHTFWS
jgi:chorismate synthase